jgi:uncharacterized membrane protein
MAEEKTKEAPKAATGGADDSKLLGALCYLPIFFINFLVAVYILATEKKNDKFLAFHAWQSLILSIIWFVVLGGLWAVTIVITIVTGGIGALIYCLLLPLGLVALATYIWGIVKAYNGEKYMFPVIGEFALKQAK